MGRRMMSYKPFRETFASPFDQYAERVGEPFVLVGFIDQPDGEHDEEVLPMFKIRFADCEEIEAWPEEVLENG
jgi:hypothetical protein